MKFYECTPDFNNPIKVFGLRPYYDGEGFCKCHKEIADKIPRVAGFCHRSTGGRICFRTNAPKFTLRMSLEQVQVDVGIPIFGASCADIYAGDRPNAKFLGLLGPETYSDKEVSVERTYLKPNGAVMEDITVILPRNETVTAFSVGIPDDCIITEPTPYRNSAPVAFYGSSITEGGCPCRVGCNYVSMLSMRDNIDVLNFGFSGNARGDLNFADYIVAAKPIAVVYDYDHNAPTADWLAETHEPFFKRLRAGLPDTPILILTRPDFVLDEDNERRRKIIRATYDNAVAAGDKNVKFFDGYYFFPPSKRYECTVDTIHPNAMGFSYMADAIESLIAEWIR